MGGTPRRKDKPRPSYEVGELRDQGIASEMDPSYKESDLLALIKRATQVAGKPAKG